MKVAVITGAGGLVGSEAVSFIHDHFDRVVGVDNNMRESFFGPVASVAWRVEQLSQRFARYNHRAVDIRDRDGLSKIFAEYSSDIALIVHAAAQPSHDWSARDPATDFAINATGTLNLLEATRQYCPDAVFIHLSTNKVYGDNPNHLPLVELEQRWEISSDHRYYERGIDESLTVDQTMHTVFGVSKLAGDTMCQEYGRYFGMKVGVFRGGCLTGPNHSGAQLHGFLSYLVKCAVMQEPYTIFGYKGKQVRDNIHSWDLVNMFWHFYQEPRQGEVYNVGGSRFSNCSVIEAISLCEGLTGNKMKIGYSEDNRIADHIWWISDVSKFRSHYPKWDYKFGLNDIVSQIIDGFRQRAVGS